MSPNPSSALDMRGADLLQKVLRYMQAKRLGFGFRVSGLG